MKTKQTKKPATKAKKPARKPSAENLPVSERQAKEVTGGRFVARR